MPNRLKVAVVAPSLRVPGGQALQADRLLSAWRNDPDVDAWLVPANPLPPKLARWALHVKYLRILVTELPDYARTLARTAYATTDACTWPAVREQWLRAYRSVIAQRSRAATKEVDAAVAESSR